MFLVPRFVVVGFSNLEPYVVTEVGRPHLRIAAVVKSPGRISAVHCCTELAPQFTLALLTIFFLKRVDVLTRNQAAYEIGAAFANGLAQQRLWLSALMCRAAGLYRRAVRVDGDDSCGSMFSEAI